MCVFLRRDGDSNPGNPFGVYTLSRRASSTTRASLPRTPVRIFTNRLQNYCFFFIYASKKRFFFTFYALEPKKLLCITGCSSDNIVYGTRKDLCQTFCHEDHQSTLIAFTAMRCRG